MAPYHGFVDMGILAGTVFSGQSIQFAGQSTPQLETQGKVILRVLVELSQGIEDCLSFILIEGVHILFLTRLLRQLGSEIDIEFLQVEIARLKTPRSGMMALLRVLALGHELLRSASSTWE